MAKKNIISAASGEFVSPKKVKNKKLVVEVPRTRTLKKGYRLMYRDKMLGQEIFKHKKEAMCRAKLFGGKVVKYKETIEYV